MNIKVIVASILLTLSLSACSPSPDDINDTIKESLQETLSTDTDFANYNLRVGNIDLIKVNDSQYKALAEVYLDDELHTVPLDVYAEGDMFEYNAIWEAQPGAFLFVAEKEIDAAIKEFNAEMDNLQSEFESSFYD